MTNNTLLSGLKKHSVGKGLSSFKEIGLQIVALTAFLSLKLLLDFNMGGSGWNEIDILPLAKQYADPSWIPADWYLNQPPGYRLIFQTLFGNLAASWGFLATSIAGRLFCYSLVASGLVLIGRQLGLSLLSLLLAVGLFLYLDRDQGLAAYEWLVGGLEAKAVAYGFVLLAIGLMLDMRFRWMALLLGLATSFHVLVGGWVSLVVAAWLLLKRRSHFQDIWDWGTVLVLYVVASGFAIAPVLQQLFTPTPLASLTPSYIYVFLRLPNHLNPLSWASDWWIKPVLYLLVLVLSVKQLQRKQSIETLSEQHASRIGLAQFTLLSLVPFILGIVVAPFDSQGQFLQYYPFRLGDVMLPLNTCLLLACALEQSFTGRARRRFFLVLIVLLSLVCSIQAVTLHNQLQSLRDFPNADQDVSSEWKEFCTWIRTHTPANTVIVSSPAELDTFTWLSERPTIAKYKFLPQNKAGILEWHQRLSDLAGGVSLWTTQNSTVLSKEDIKDALTEGYEHLTTSQAQALMVKYKADYFVAYIEQHLDLPIAYRNSRYILYGKNS